MCLKTIFQSVDGKTFENQKDCLVHEFELKGGEKHFQSLVQHAHDILSKRHGVTFENVKAKAWIDWDEDPNTDELVYAVHQEVYFEVYKDGVMIGDPYNRGGMNEDAFSVEGIVRDVEEENIIQTISSFEGVLEECTDMFCYTGLEFKLNGYDIHHILQSLVGKKIKIEEIKE
jgi:hypothetical protein